ncbi:MAG: hypothetical protein ACRD2P_17465, partial [Terriglobia bacterium]
YQVYLSRWSTKREDRMNKAMLSNLKNQIVRLRPIPRQHTKESLGIPQDDLECQVVDASPQGVDLYVLSSQDHILLKPDHIREYLSDTDRGGYKRGFLHLKVQAHLRYRDLWLEPLF